MKIEIVTPFQAPKPEESDFCGWYLISPSPQIKEEVYTSFKAAQTQLQYKKVNLSFLIFDKHLN